jgi:hypothetical protein
MSITKKTPAEVRDASIKAAKAARKAAKDQAESTYEQAVAAAWAQFTADSTAE